MKAKSLSESAVLLVLGKTIQALSGFILLMFLVRLLDKQAFADYQLYILITMTMATLMSIGLPQSYFYYLPRLNKEAQAGFIYETVKKQIILFSLLALLATLIFVLYKGSVSKSDLILAAGILGSSLLLILYESLLNVLISLEKGHVSAKYSIIFGILYICIQLVVVLTSKNAEILFASWAGVYLLVVILIARYIKNNYQGMRREPGFVTLKEHLAYSFPLWGSYAIGQLNLRIDGLIIASFFSATVFANFNVGAREIPLIAVVSYNLTQIIMPRMVEYYDENNQKEFILIWHRAIRATCYTTYPVFFMLFFFANEIINLLYTSSYSDAVEIFRIYLVLILFRLTAYGQIVSATGSTKIILIGVVLCFIFNLLFSYGMLNTLGWTAPAYGTVLAQLLLIIILLGYLTRKLSIKFKDILPYKNIAMISIISFLYSGVSYFIYSSYLQGLVYFLIIISIYFAIYFMTIWFVGIIESSEKRIFLNYMNKLRVKI